MKLFIESTRVSPFIAYSPSQNILSLRGRSSPENPIEFYKPVFEFLESYKSSKNNSLTVDVCLEYFNTSSTKVLFNIFKTIDRLKINNNIDTTINWFYEEWDDDMMEIGEDFSQDLKLSFNLKEMKDISKIQLNSAVAA
jgi:hypothetical protein